LKIVVKSNTYSLKYEATLFSARKAASYLLWDADIIFMFVSATALFPARLPDEMELTKRFEEATAYASVNANTLEQHKPYPIIRAKRIPTKYGLSVVLILRIAETNIVQIFLPIRYGEVMSDADIDAINSKAVSLHLVYEGVCESSKSYLLAIES